MRAKRRRTAKTVREKAATPGEKVAITTPGVTKAPQTKKRGRNDPDFCPEGFYTRRMLAARLGLTDSQLRGVIASGLLRSSRKNATGYALYPESAVRMIVRRKEDGSLPRHLRPDALAAITEGGISRREVCYTAEEGTRVFKMIEAGTSYGRIAIETGLHAQLLMSIVNDYTQLEGTFMVPKSILDDMNKVTLPGNFPLRSAADILEVLQAAEQDRVCLECEKRPSASACGVCVRQHVIAGLQAEVRARQKQEKAVPAVPGSDAEHTEPKATDSDTRIASDAGAESATG